jgi:hypothetical protein
MADFEGELDEIETDMVSQERDVIWPWEEQPVADQRAAHFEKKSETFSVKKRRVRGIGCKRWVGSKSLPLRRNGGTRLLIDTKTVYLAESGSQPGSNTRLPLFVRSWWRALFNGA